MDSTVISPAPGQAVITTDDGHHDRHHGGHHGGHHEGFRETRLDADYRSIIAQGERYGTIQGDRINGVGSLTQAGFGVVHDRICDATRTVTGHVVDSARAAALASCKTDDGVAVATASLRKDICESTSDLRRDLCDLGSQLGAVAKDTALGFKDLTALGYQVEGRALLEAAKNANAIAVQADKNFYALSLENAKNAAASQLQAQTFASAAAVQAQTIASAATLQAQMIASESAKQAAECCCELKELIRSTDAARVAAQLAAAQGQIAALFARNVAPPVPGPV